MKIQRIKHILIIGIISLITTGIVLSSKWNYFIKNHDTNNTSVTSYQINTSKNSLVNYYQEEANITFQINVLKSAVSRNNIMYKQYNNIFKHNINYVHTQKNIIKNKIKTANSSIKHELDILDYMKLIIHNHPYNYLKFFQDNNYIIPQINYQNKINISHSFENIKSNIHNIYLSNVSVKNISYNSEEAVIGFGAITSLISDSKKLLVMKVHFDYNQVFYFSKLSNNLTTSDKNLKKYNSVKLNNKPYQNKFITKSQSINKDNPKSNDNDANKINKTGYLIGILKYLNMPAMIAVPVISAALISVVSGVIYFYYQYHIITSRSFIHPLFKDIPGNTIHATPYIPGSVENDRPRFQSMIRRVRNKPKYNGGSLMNIEEEHENSRPETVVDGQSEQVLDNTAPVNELHNDFTIPTRDRFQMGEHTERLDINSKMSGEETIDELYESIEPSYRTFNKLTYRKQMKKYAVRMNSYRGEKFRKEGIQDKIANNIYISAKEQDIEISSKNIIKLKEMTNLVGNTNNRKLLPGEKTTTNGHYTMPNFDKIDTHNLSYTERKFIENQINSFLQFKNITPEYFDVLSKQYGIENSVAADIFSDLHEVISAYQEHLKNIIDANRSESVDLSKIQKLFGNSVHSTNYFEIFKEITTLRKYHWKDLSHIQMDQLNLSGIIDRIAAL